jgi:dolichol-phosphate mannosyltransferase
MPRGGFDYFLLDQAVYRELQRLDTRNSFLQSDILWLGYEPIFIEYKRLRRPFGRSQWTLAKKIKYFIDGAVSASYLPIRLISFLGLATSFFGLVYAVVIVVVRVLNRTPFPGYAPIMIVMLVMSGLIMTMLGVIGEYLWRIHDEVRSRPRYIVRDTYL